MVPAILLPGDNDLTLSVFSLFADLHGTGRANRGKNLPNRPSQPSALHTDTNQSRLNNLIPKDLIV